MEIVPMREKLVVEARLNPLDRGYVDEGQSVVVKVSSYDFVRYGGLDGHVTHIAADANSDQNGVPYYRVVIETDKAYLGGAEGLLPIMPGMQATVDIHIGEKSVLEYLVRPVLKLKDEAFRER
jgi:adhesin transport system membrane fusion protein